MQHRRLNTPVQFALAIVIIVGTLGATGANLIRGSTTTALDIDIAAQVDQDISLLSLDRLQSIARANATSLGLATDAVDPIGIIVSLGQWLTLTDAGMNFELFGVTRSTPVYVAEFGGGIDNRQLESEFNYNRLVVAIRADTGASMGYIAIPAGQPTIGEISVTMPDTYAHSIPPTSVPLPPLDIPSAPSS